MLGRARVTDAVASHSSVAVEGLIRAFRADDYCAWQAAELAAQGGPVHHADRWQQLLPGDRQRHASCHGTAGLLVAVMRM